MPILALDTATLVSSVALAAPDRLLAELTLQTKKTHSEQLMPHIEQLLALAGTAKEAIEAVAVSIGPGSFTGLRIGLATAKALAYALQIPLVGVPTLDALAFGCPAAGDVIAATMDAQKGNIYLALYKWNENEFAQITPARVVPLDTALRELKGLRDPVIVMGEAVELYKEQINAAGGLTVSPPHIAMPRAGSVAMLGWKLLNDGTRHDVMQLEPLYIRRSEAEELWEKRRGTAR